MSPKSEYMIFALSISAIIFIFASFFYEGYSVKLKIVTKTSCYGTAGIPLERIIRKVFCI